MANMYGNICTCTRCNGIVHTIRRGDTLYLLSRHYKVSVNDIMNANRNINIYNLRIGDEICIPVNRNENMINPRETVYNDDMEIMNDDNTVESKENIKNNDEIINKYEKFVNISQADEIKEEKIKDYLENMTFSELAQKLKEFDK